MRLNNDLKIILIDCLVSFLIMVYGTYRCRTTSFKDPLTGCISGNQHFCKFVDGWGVMHFFYFLVLGFSFPKNLPTIFWMGVLWEMVESYSHDHPFYLAECKYVISTDKESGWWYGRWQDIVMNTLGMFCGVWLHHAMKKKNCLLSRKMI